MPKLIVTDLDGTLLNNHGEVSDYTMGVFSALRARGHVFAVATGRPYKTSRRHSAKIGAKYTIVSNGAIVYEGNTALLKLYIPTKEQNLLIKDLLTLKQILQISVETENCYYSNYDDSKENWYAWKALNIKYNDLKNGIMDLAPQMSVTCTDPKIVVDLAKKYDLKLFGNSSCNWYQFAHKGATKLNGIKHICKKLGIKLEDVIAFGDDYNDIEMLRGCGIGVAMLNAAKETKDAADFVCGENDRSGVAKWLERNLLK